MRMRGAVGPSAHVTRSSALALAHVAVRGVSSMMMFGGSVAECAPNSVQGYMFNG